MDLWIRIQSALLAAVISSALAVTILLRNRRNRLYQLYATFNLNLVAWYISDALSVYLGASTPFLDKVRVLVAIMIPLSALRFFRAFVSDKSLLSDRMYRLFVAMAVVLAVLVVADVHRETELVDRAIYGYICIALYVSLYFIYRRFKRLESKVERTRLQYLMVSGAVAFTLALLDYLPGIGYYFFGNILTILFLYFVFQIILKLRVLDLYEFLGRAIVMATFSFVVAGIYVTLVVWWRKEIDLFVFNTLIASIVLYILYEPMRVFVEERMNHLLFRERYEFEAHLEALRRQMSTLINVEDLADTILRRLETSRRVTHAAVYLLEEYGLAYSAQAYMGPLPLRRLDRVTHHPFLRRLRDQAAVVLENLERERKQLEEHGAPPGAVEELDNVLATMTALHSGVALPFIADGHVLGFLTIKDDRLREAYSSEELRLLAGVAAQATLAIENSRLFDKVRDRDRLAALGEMSAGLAHEIRNPLGAIKGAAQLLEGGEPDPEMLRIIVDETNRLNTVVSEFLDYARPNRKPNLVETDVNRVVELTLDVVRADNPGRHEIQTRLMNVLPKVQSDPEQLRHVFLNLAQNAMQAMTATAQSGTLTVTTRLVESRGAALEGETALIRIEFADVGAGIPDEVRKNLFIPFFTTKQRGTGLGLALSLRLVRNLGGNIEVVSRPGQGSTFTVVLPARLSPVSPLVLAPTGNPS
ncbi:MAG: GAF domain-containing protein [Myxococcales bacterium]|nr:GAF domain-containing protein [Myxococcales bacterium]